MPGSLLLLASLYGTLKERGTGTVPTYALLILTGTAVGAAMLGFVSVGQASEIKLGAAYGLVTALCWTALHLFSKLASHSSHR